MSDIEEIFYHYRLNYFHTFKKRTLTRDARAVNGNTANQVIVVLLFNRFNLLMRYSFIKKCSAIHGSAKMSATPVTIAKVNRQDTSCVQLNLYIQLNFHLQLYLSFSIEFFTCLENVLLAVASQPRRQAATTEVSQEVLRWVTNNYS